MVTVWGLAAGHGTTKAAARGAFTFRDYPSRAEATRAWVDGDWLEVMEISIEGGEQDSM